MASLADKLKQVRGPGGQLSQETTEEVQSLAGQAGLPAPPTTAIGAGMIGASPNQQKMMGTPVQKQAAFNTLAQQPPESNLSDALRRGQVRSQATAQEQGAIQKSQDMQNLGALGDRVTGFIEAQRQKLEGAAGQGVAVQSVGTFAGPQGANQDITSLKDLLAQYRANPTDQNTLLQVNKALGYDINTQLSPQQVDQLYESAVDSIAKGGAGNVDDDLTVSDLVASQNFGYDTATLSQLLGVPEESVAKMSVGDLRNQINQVASQEFSKTAQLEQQAQSGQLGQAERGLARQGAREASRVGQRSSEADIGHLEQQIQNADQVSFGGQTYKVDDLLKDDTISGIISDYMNSGEGSEARTKLEQTEPALVDFIKKNEAVLHDASEQMKQGAQTFKETQEANKALQSSAFGGISVDPSVMKAILPGYGELSAEKINPDLVPVLAYARMVGPQLGAKFGNELNKAVAADPSIAGQLKDLNGTELSNLGIEKGAGSNWDNLQKNKQTRQQILGSNDMDAIAHLAYGTSTDGLQRMAATADTMNVLGLSPNGVDPTLGAIMNMNTRQINPNALKFYALNAAPTPTLKQAANGVQGFETKPFKDSEPATPLDTSLVNKLSKDAAKGSINYGDLYNNQISLDEAIRLQELGGKGGVSANDVNRFWGEKRDQNTNENLGAIMSRGDRGSQANELSDMILKGDDKHINKDLLQSKLNEMLGADAAARALQAAKDRASTRLREKNQNELKTVLTGGAWSALPPETQSMINDVAGDLTEGQMEQLKKTFQWNNNKSIGDNLGVMATQLTTLPGRSGLDAAQKLRDNVMSGKIGEGIAAGATSAINQAGGVLTGKKKIKVG